MIFDTEYGTLDVAECDLEMFKNMLNDNISSFAAQSQIKTEERKKSKFKLSSCTKTSLGKIGV